MRPAPRHRSRPPREAQPIGPMRQRRVAARAGRVQCLDQRGRANLQAPSGCAPRSLATAPLKDSANVVSGLASEAMRTSSDRCFLGWTSTLHSSVGRTSVRCPPEGWAFTSGLHAAHPATPPQPWGVNGCRPRRASPSSPGIRWRPGCWAGGGSEPRLRPLLDAAEHLSLHDESDRLDDVPQDARRPARWVGEPLPDQ